MAKNDNLLKLYDLYSTYSRFPRDSNEQREIVKKFYGQISGNKSPVDVSDANSGRIYYVAKTLYEKASRKMKELSSSDFDTLSALSSIDFKGQDLDSIIERIGRTTENCDNPSIISSINCRLHENGYDIVLNGNNDTSFDYP